MKRRIAKYRDYDEEERKRGVTDPYRVEREGAGQVFVVGPPNSGEGLGEIPQKVFDMLGLAVNLFNVIAC